MIVSIFNYHFILSYCNRLRDATFAIYGGVNFL
jgi:hypothetical protein